MVHNNISAGRDLSTTKESEGMDRPPWTDNFVPQQKKKKKKLGNWELKKKGSKKREEACLVLGVYSFVSCLLCLSVPFSVRTAGPSSVCRKANNSTKTQKKNPTNFCFSFETTENVQSVKMTVCRVLHFVSNEMGLNIFVNLKSSVYISRLIVGV